MKSKTVIANAIIAAIYIALTTAFMVISFGPVQFRLSEMLNHLVVFNKKYISGLIAGVFISNLLFSSLGAYDLVFGLGHSALSLIIVVLTTAKMKNPTHKMILNTIVFSVMSFLIAVELNIVFEAPFWATYLTIALGEFVVMIAGVPVMTYLDERIGFSKRIES